MYASLGYLISITANEFDGFKLRKENEDFVLYENIIPNFTENINGENVYYFDVKLEDSISKYNEEFIKPVLPDVPKCIIAGSATDLCAKQVLALKNSRYFDNFREYDLKFEDIYSGISEHLLSDMFENIN